MTTHPLQRGLRVAAGLAAFLTSVLFLYAIASTLMTAPQVQAHTDPVGCDSTGVTLSLTALRADGTTPIGAGTVAPGETIKYRATLSYAGSTNCNYEGGDLDIITPDGVNHDVDGGTIPLISSTTPFVGSLVTYVVNSADIGGDNDLDATADYTDGISHLGENNVSPVGAHTPIATVVTGQIIVDKVTNPSGDSQSFTFTTTGSGYNGFSLTDQGAPNSQTLNPGTYSVAETGMAGWSLASSTCSSSNQNVETPASISLQAGETVTCTFTNTKQGHIIIVKDAVPNNAQDFSFTNNFGSSTPNPFMLDDDSDGTLSNTRDTTVMPGTYSISEGSVSGWTQTSATCSDQSPISAIAVSPGETVTCTFTNTLQSGHLIVQKTTLPSATSTIFSITATGTGTITGGGAGTTTDAVDKDYEVTSGTYSVSEGTLPTGWAQTSNTCNNVVVGAGETKTCVITNTFTPPPAEYCSPGYWKQSQHFDSWVGYSPNQTFQSVFGTNITIMWSAKGKPAPVTNPTLLQVLEANGGGVSSLARAAVGALLNASALDSSLTPTEVIAIFNNAYPNGDFEAAKAQYTFPEMCPLN